MHDEFMASLSPRAMFPNLQTLTVNLVPDGLSVCGQLLNVLSSVHLSRVSFDITAAQLRRFHQNLSHHQMLQKFILYGTRDGINPTRIIERFQVLPFGYIMENATLQSLLSLRHLTYST